MSIAMGTKSVLTPLPYDDKEPTQQQENFFYVMNQILLDAKQQNLTLADVIAQSVTATFTSLELGEIRDAITDLQMSNITFDFGSWRVVINRNTATLEEG